MKKYFLPNLLLAVILLISTMMVPVSAASSGQDICSLTVKFTSEDYVFSGVDFKIFNAYDLSGNLRGDFVDYEIADDPFTTESLGELALTLASYAARDNIPADFETATNSNGEAIFSNIPAGIYLVVGESVRVGDYVFVPKPFLVNVPYFDQDDEIVYDVFAQVKFDRRDADIEYIERSVVKIWDDDNSPDRPDEIEVQLLKDGEEYDRVTLNDDNDWSYTWTDLDSFYQWTVTEVEVPDGYTVRISFEGDQFTITNRLIPSDSQEESSSESEASSDDGVGGNTTNSSSSTTDSSSSDTSSTTSSSSSTNSTPSGGGSGDSTLPQTGQVKWPVPFLFFIGIAMLLAGIVVSKLNDNEKD